ncbi:MAG: PHP domain-containing protein, partial [Candidatus Parcubacteria bacterium]|nr:PHP domain-containing protein [Candidatus Parcubacteria bacterium]
QSFFIMTNREIARIFKNISTILELKNDSRFRVIAYERAADVISNLTKDLDDIYKEGGIKTLEEVPGVGVSIAEKIVELLQTGKLKAYAQLTREFPEKMLVLTEVPGIGPKTAEVLYKKLKIDSIDKLARAAKSGVIEQLPHFKKQSAANILRGIGQFYTRTKERNRMVLTTAGPIAEDILEFLHKNKLVKRCEAVGSLRRMKETIGDIDIVVATQEPKKIIEYFSKAGFVKNILAKGDTKISITHSLYEFLGMQYIEPELREDRGEIETALAYKLPKIIGYREILGDLHCHTNKSDGSNTISELAAKALSLKYKYLGISDHTVGLGVASGLSDKKLLQHKAEIQKVNKKFKSIRILAGAEINIKANGQLDISAATIKKLDYSIGSVHSAFNQDEATMTKRILAGIKSGIKIFGHPSGRLIGHRHGYDVDWTEIFKACAKYKVALEINSFPERLDLKDTLIKDALSYDCKFCIDSDAHALEHMDLIKYGIATARRGWATRADVINSWDLDKLLKWFK